MKQIKYRQLVGSKWHYWGFIPGSFNDKICFTGPVTNQMANPIHCQFTGLIDINGVEICEGDIVSVAGHGNCEVKICPYYGVTYKGGDGYEAPHADCAAELDYPTVIGNIYQNPELLK